MGTRSAIFGHVKKGTFGKSADAEDAADVDADADDADMFSFLISFPTHTKLGHSRKG